MNVQTRCFAAYGPIRTASLAGGRCGRGCTRAKASHQALSAELIGLAEFEDT
jgi:hypothetical protein